MFLLLFWNSRRVDIKLFLFCPAQVSDYNVTRLSSGDISVCKKCLYWHEAIWFSPLLPIIAKETVYHGTYGLSNCRSITAFYKKQPKSEYLGFEDTVVGLLKDHFQPFAHLVVSALSWCCCASVWNCGLSISFFGFLISTY